MRRTYLAVILIVASAPAGAQGFFYGGVADGNAVARDMELRQRALDLDRRYGTDEFERLQQDRRQRDLQNALDENNRLLRDDRARRGILLPPIR
jgi:hypothetical protein